MENENGVYKVPCVVNGLRLKFVFDTGASNVCISLTEANLMLDNGYLDRKDIIGTGKSQIADGSIIENTKIILRELNINGIILRNIEAIVVNELKAPLLLGQSAIQKLGKIQIEGNEIVVLNVKNNLSEVEIKEMFNQASSLYLDKMYVAASDIYEKLYDQKLLSDLGIIQMADCYYNSANYSKALRYYLEVPETVNYDKFDIYYNIGYCYNELKDYDQAELFIQKSKQYALTNFNIYLFYSTLSDINTKKNQCYLADKNGRNALIYLFLDKGFTDEDFLSGRAKDVDIADYLYLYACNLIDCGVPTNKYYMMVSAYYGNVFAIKYCRGAYWNYQLVFQGKNK